MNFYKFRGAYSKNEARIQADVEYDTQSFLGVETPLVYFNKFKVAQGKTLYDIVEFHDSTNFAISEKLNNILLENNVTGWKSFPIVIDGRNESFYAFQNLSEAGPILNLDALNRYETEITEFDIKTWDGSDIFHLKDTGINVCTEKVMELIERNRVSNIKIRPL